MDNLRIREATAADIDNLCGLIFEHGPNPWNYLPPAEVTTHLQQIADGSVSALLAERGGELLGFVSYQYSRHFARYQPPTRLDLEHAYICEAVTHRAVAGQGLGSRLLKQVVTALAEQGVADIYIDRHEENAASAGMMRKAGFVEIETYADPERRPNGSRRTTVCCLRLHV
ncbi:GNAT family N-acetyltransferase [Pseudomonas sp. EA_35y_Pfl2_R111]|uniref:GNAT family N-acetyltransferase n=1 Tax=Pseudomonas sp. EA_35y_Pfl2_R111 TaxID=3088689 RepID=UPI0030DDD22F